MGDVDYRTLMFRLIRASSFAAEDCYGSETMGRRDDAERAVTTYVDSLRAAVRAADAAIDALSDRMGAVHTHNANGCVWCNENSDWTGPVREWRETRAKCGDAK